jgi:mannonate dehydratase
MLEHSWRWFGPADRITLKEIVQTGASGIVTALHQVPIGDVWSSEAIRERKGIVEKEGLSWQVVESIPVHEDIKRRQGNYKIFTENYAQTIRNLGKEGIKTVCYNFMPVLDWSRTDLKFRFPDGSESLHFSYIHFAAIDIYILDRPGAADSYPDEISKAAGELFNKLDKGFRKNMEDTFLLGFPGSGETLRLGTVKERIQSYNGIDNKVYRENLFEFLNVIVPAAEEAGVRLAIHPDDPPFPLMGLPRIVSNLEDVLEIIKFKDSTSNGITFCTGSFGASFSNDLPLMAEKLAPRINFAHLRNVTRDDQKNFHENYFFEGDVDMYSVMKTLILEDIKRLKTEKGYTGIPVRPDHGAQMLGDLLEINYPGYSLYGRLKSLAEIRGLEIGIRRGLEK